MLLAGMAVITGIVVACYSPQPIDRYWVSYLPICLYLAYVTPRQRFAWLMVSSFLWVSGHIHWQLDHRLSALQNNKRLTVIGEVINIPTHTEYSTRFIFKPVSMQNDIGQNYTGKLPQKLKLNWRSAPENLAPGQIWRLEMKLKQPHGFQNPGGFDYERWLFSKGFHATGYVLTSDQNRLLDKDLFSLSALRYHINQQIEAHCENCRYGGLIQALAIGYRGNIDPQQRRLLQQTGTAHLIAISGLHIGIISAVFYALGRFLWIRVFFYSRINRREFAMMMAWMAGLGYSLLAGFDLPAQRAMLMLSVVLLSLLLRTPLNLLNTIVTAMILVLVAEPLAVLSESFWLTFSALFIIAFGSLLLQQQKSRLRQLVIIQCLFSILFIPLSLFIFGQIHSASLLANLLAVPLVSFVIVPINFILLTLFWLPDALLEVLYAGLNGLLAVLLNYLQFLQDSGLQAMSLSKIAGWKLLFLSFLLVLLLLPKGVLPKRCWIALLPMLVFLPQRQLDWGELEMTVLDVGMGTSIVMQTRHHSLIYDLGPGNDKGYSLGEWVVLPYLQHQGIARPERIVISHADQDHAGGFYAIRDKLDQKTVFTGTVEGIKQKFSQLGIVRNCHQTSSWMWDGVKFEFLSTIMDKTDSENNRSCVLKISLLKQTILIAGDIEKRQELKLLAVAADKLKANILVAPHHGSLTSSSAEFISAIAAEDIIFTTGFLNRWGFPRAEVKSRYLATGALLYQTDKDGAVQIKCREGDCRLQTFRQLHPRLWY